MTPVVSVVMSVYNDAQLLPRTIQGILDQSFTDFEFIIINDGSTDHSQSIVEDFARQDDRIVLLQQANQGLTRSLITGCEKARGKYIARQDNGDFSRPERLELQFQYMQQHSDCAAVFTGFQDCDKDGNIISTHVPSQQQTSKDLTIDDETIATPSHHGCCMLRKEKYIKSGGYRPAFYLAQDLDLWIRMSELGKIHVINEILYEALLTTQAISGKFNRLQRKYHAIIIESARKRRSHQSDHEQLRKAAAIRPVDNKLSSRINQSRTLYFMASCMNKRNPDIANKYFKQALSRNPLNLKAWYKLLFKN